MNQQIRWTIFLESMMADLRQAPLPYQGLDSMLSICLYLYFYVFLLFCIFWFCFYIFTFFFLILSYFNFNSYSHYSIIIFTFIFIPNDSNKLLYTISTYKLFLCYYFYRVMLSKFVYLHEGKRIGRRATP